MKRQPRRKYWFIASEHHVLGRRENGEALLRRTKRGFPSGAYSFDTEAQALDQLLYLRSAGQWPLFMHTAKAVQLFAGPRGWYPKKG